MSLVRFKKQEINQIMEIYSKKIFPGAIYEHILIFVAGNIEFLPKMPQRGAKMVKLRI